MEAYSYFVDVILSRQLQHPHNTIDKLHFWNYCLKINKYGISDCD